MSRFLRHYLEVHHLQMVLACLLMAGCLSGCAASSDPTRRDLATAQQLASDPNLPENLRPYYQRFYWEGESNAALNRMRLASAAIQDEHWQHAERALDEAIRDIEALGPADARSRKALSEFQPEDIKKFKGEPYERSMAYFLRGLLYLRTKDWSNARACFKSVQIQGPPSAHSVQRGSWAGADWLEGWCARQLNETSEAERCWKRASRAHLAPPSDSDRVLCVALLGWGPIKVPEGKQGERLAYRKAESQTTQARVQWNSSSKSIALADDLYLQATGRGLRHMDVVNKEKADTKEGTQTAGGVLMVGGAGTAIAGAVKGDTTVAAAGLGAVAAGMAAQGVASSMHPKADTRAWDLLPGHIGILSLTPSSSKQSLRVQFLDENGGVIREHKVNIQTDSQPELILFTER